MIKEGINKQKMTFREGSFLSGGENETRYYNKRSADYTVS